MKRYIVLDQNVLRKLILQERLATRPYEHYVLPDSAFLEMTKATQRESTLSNSLRFLSEYPKRVHVCYSVSEALAYELDTLRPINGHMLHLEATAYVRNLLDSVRTNISGYAFERIRNDPNNHHASLAKDHLNHAKNKLDLQELIEETKNILSDDIQKRLRAKKVTDAARLQIISDIVGRLLPQILVERGISNGRAKAFIKQRPLVLRYLLLKVWYYIYWIENGGLDAFPDYKVTNEEIDKHYVLSATFFHGLLSEENRINDSYRDLSLLLKICI